jgi:hypothetical protein
MAMIAHVDSLKSKHADLDAKIADEERRPLPDEAALHALKKLKLRIKDELAILERAH